MKHPSRPLRPQPSRRGAILACLSLFILAVALLPGPAAAQAPDAVAPPPPVVPTLALGPSTPGTIGTAFAAAGAEFKVPPGLLAAIGYVESRWDDRGGAPNDYGQYGIMGLYVPPGGDTLAQAAALIGLPPSRLQTDSTANIRGAAALLHHLAANVPGAGPASLSPWYAVVARYSAISDPVVARSYAWSVFQVLQSGASLTTRRGETITLPASPDLAIPDAVDPLAASPNSDDYPAAHWVAAASNNYQLHRPYGPLTYLIIHDTEGSYQAAISWFQNPSAGVSAHYVIRSSDGDITQMVHNADTAFQAGNWDYNVRGIGFEHEGYASQQGWYTQAMYNASAAIVRTMADRFDILKDHAHIIGHYQVPNQSPPAHTDPGPNWDWASYMALVRGDSQAAARVRNTDSGFTASPGIIDQAHGWTTYPGIGWNGGTAYKAAATSGAPTNAATWSTSLPHAGLYDIYAFIPWVDNHTQETHGAQYTVATTNGPVQVTMSQKALTDAGILQNGNTEGEWGDLGLFDLSTWTSVSLNNSTADGSPLNVWFDTIMWIPAGAVASPTPMPPTPVPPTATRTRTPIPTATAIPTPPNTSTPVDTPTPSWTPGPCGMVFSDLPDTDWSWPYVNYLFCQGVISGYGDGTFRGGSSANRGQLAKMLSIGMAWYIPYPQTPTFSDVPAESPYYYYVEDAYAHGAIAGYADGTFRPYRPGYAGTTEQDDRYREGLGARVAADTVVQRRVAGLLGLPLRRDGARARGHRGLRRRHVPAV